MGVGLPPGGVYSIIQDGRNDLWLVGSDGSGLRQLTTHKSREKAHRFYDRLGFRQSHFGYKMVL